MTRGDRLVVLGAFFAGGCTLLSGASDLHSGDDPGDGSVLDGASDMDGRVDPDGAAPDGSSSGDALPDAPALPRCNPLKPFDAPVLIGGLSSVSNDHSLSLSPDERTVYFASDRPGGAGGYDLYTATRASADAPFSLITPLTALNTVNDDRHPSITADGLTLVFRTNIGAATGDLSIAQRVTTAVPFKTSTALTAVSTPEEEADPFVTPSGDALYLFATRAGPLGVGTTTGIYVAMRSGTSFGAPVAVPGLTGFGDPALTSDALTIFVGASGPTTMGQDIEMATRPSKTAPFPAPAPVPALNSAASEQPDWVAPDGCRLYMTSSRSGTSQLYVAKRGN